MCVGVPMRVETRTGASALCAARGWRREVSLLLIGDETVGPGDDVLVHQGFALRRLDAEEAALIWEALDLAAGALPHNPAAAA